MNANQRRQRKQARREKRKPRIEKEKRAAHSAYKKQLQEKLRGRGMTFGQLPLEEGDPNA